ncbi:MAG: hypothetical protein N3A55_00810 [Methylohalobius sp.]|nr:hypothetical protein [Methylohalobius sp.]
MPGWWSLLPALIAIPVVFFTHRLVLALGLYVLLGALILEKGWLPQVFGRLLSILAQVVVQPNNLLIFAFSLLIGGLVGLIQRAGGIEGFARFVESQGRFDRPNRIALLAFVTSMLLFVESSFGTLVAGLIALPLFDRYRLLRLRLSYLLDATCAPKCMLIPLNAWGAYVAGLLVAQGVAQSMATVLSALPLTFYGWIAIVLAGWVAAMNWEIPWRIAISAKTVGEAVHFTEALASYPQSPRRACDLWGPIGGLVLGVLALLCMGWNPPLAIFTSVGLTLSITALVFGARGLLPWREVTWAVWWGIRALWPLAYLMVFAFAVGATTRALGTGEFLAGALSGRFDPVWLPALVFSIGCVISFASGTSWGTFAILIPIAVPLAQAFHVPLPLMVGAALSGGLFGDHCSPVSDTTMVASIAAGVRPIDHVRHQLPYAMLGAGIALGLYLMAGWMVSR